MDKIRQGIDASFSVQTSVASPHGPPSTKQASLDLTRTQICTSLRTDFLIGGIGAGLLLVLITGTFSYIDSYIRGLSCVIGLVIVAIAIRSLYHRLPAQGCEERRAPN